MTLEKDLKVGKEYWLDGEKVNCGVFHSFKGKTPFFTPIINNDYSLCENGLIGFCSTPEWEWEEKKSFPTKTVIVVVAIVIVVIAVFAFMASKF